jgi:chromosome segregation protein
VEQAQRHAQEQAQRVRHEQAELAAERQQLDVEQAQDQAKLQQAQAQQAALIPQLEQAQEQASRAQQTLMQAEQAHTAWREAVADQQRELEASRHALRLEETQQRHLRERLSEAERRSNRLQAEQAQLVLQPLQDELAQLEQCNQVLADQHTELAQQAAQAAIDLQQVRERLHRQTTALAELRAQLHTQQGRLSSLQTLQQAALQAQSGQVPAWLTHQGHADPVRLLHQLEVNPGWERAVETVLMTALEGFCIPDLEGLLPALCQLPEGALTLVDREAGMAQGAPETLAAQVRGPAAVAEWLAGVHIAPDLAAAQALRAGLKPGESVITPQGIWLGRGWVRLHKQVQDDGMLARARQIRELETDLAQQTERVALQQAELEALRQMQAEQERRREQVMAQAQQAQRACHEHLARLEGLRQRLAHGQERAQRITRELDEQTQVIHNLTQALAASAAQLDELQRQTDAQAQAKHLLDGQRVDFESRIAQARRTVRESSQHQQSLAVQLEAAVNQARHAEEQRLRLHARQERLAQREQDLQAQLAALLAPLPALQDKQTNLLEERQQLEMQLVQAREQMTLLDEELRELLHRHDGQQRAAEALREATTDLRLQLSMQSAQRQRWMEQLAELGLAAPELAAQLPAAANQAEWEARSHQLGEQIGRLGAVNLTALEECQTLATRKYLLDQQDADLNEALATLEQAMARIDGETRVRFQDTFERLNAGLQQMFPRLFGGGHAYLELTDDEWLAAGVTIMARPPGKRNSNIQMLSGGEKALTAVALVFAIFELNPAPFCLLDEVDAPLDEANVGRFCALVQEMSARVQFIFITHNKATMELSSQLLGVTMHELGVSRIVAVDVAEAMQLASVER